METNTTTHGDKMNNDTPTPAEYEAAKALVLAEHARWVWNDQTGTRLDLSGTDLRRADLSRAWLTDADLSRADLRRADLSRADLSGANLSRADLTEAKR